MDKKELGSITAKGGFANEKAICNKFNQWKTDSEAVQWLEIMGYSIKKIDSVEAIQIPIRVKKSDIERYGISSEDYDQVMQFKKADAQIKITIQIGKLIRVENISLKKANSDADYNQIDKRSVDTYQRMWGFNNELADWLKLFSGEYIPSDHNEKLVLTDLRNDKRIFMDEMPENIQKKIIQFFKKNKIMVVSDIIKGRGGFSANWMLVTRYDKQNDVTTWILKDINVVMNYLGSGDVKISPKGSISIGRITLQRKGGTPDPTKLQFKIKPCELFNLDV